MAAIRASVVTGRPPRSLQWFIRAASPMSVTYIIGGHFLFPASCRNLSLVLGADTTMFARVTLTTAIFLDRKKGPWLTCSSCTSLLRGLGGLKRPKNHGFRDGEKEADRRPGPYPLRSPTLIFGRRRSILGFRGPMPKHRDCPQLVTDGLHLKLTTPD